MALERGTALSVLLSATKAEIGDYSGTNTARDAELSLLLSSKQDQLAIEYHWSFLEDRWNVPVTASTQYVNWPTTNERGGTTSPDVDQLSKMEVKWASQYLDVVYGIGEEEYNAFDFSEGQACDPIQRWREAPSVAQTTESAMGFEVWPVPVSDQVVRITGQRMMTALASPSDPCDLDGLLLVLGVASDILTRKKQADAQLCLGKFTRRLQKLGAKNQTRFKERSLCYAGESDFKRQRKLAGLLVAVK